MSTCRPALARTGALALVFGTSVGLALGPISPALAQDPTGPSTVQAVVGADGGVRSVERVGGGEAAADDLPVSLAIADSTSDGTRTVGYTVQNTQVEKQSVSYTAADGTTRTADQDVALPLVAQLSVRLPATMTDVQAFGARITHLADGSKELLWSMVLFGPVGAPTADVRFTAKGTGEPVARLATQAVQPNATPGLSTTGQAANATVNGNGILSTVAKGADEGLTKLADGVAQLLDGLEKLEAGAGKLASGLEAAGDGSTKLADGSEKAHAGSGKLTVGLRALADGAGQVADGNGKLATGATALSAGAGQLAEGAGKLDAGTAKVAAGLSSAADGGDKLLLGSQALATGSTAAATGAASLSEGLAKISAGLGALSAAQGLPAALDGAKRLRAGVDQLRAGLGAPTTKGTILNGLSQLGGGLAQVKGGLDSLGAPTGLPAAKGGVDASKGGVDKSLLGVNGSNDGVARILQGFQDAVARGGSLDQLSGGLAVVGGHVAAVQLATGCTPSTATPTATIGAAACVDLAKAAGTAAALRNGVEAPDAGTRAKTQAAVDGLTTINGILGQVSGGLGQVSGGLGQVSGGLGTAIGGIGQLQTGVGALQAGNSQVAAGVVQIAHGLLSGDPAKPGVGEGLDSLVAGLTAAVAGVGQLAAGSQAAATGAASLAEGNGKIAAGNGQLATGAEALSKGLRQLADGGTQLKAGTSALAAGSGKLAAGAGQVADGAGKLADGSGKVAAGADKAAAGSAELGNGIGQIAAGQRKVADGLPAAIDGSAQLAGGLTKVVEGQTKVANGLGDVKAKAVTVLSSQFRQGTDLARLQLAGLDAASAKITSTPGAADTTWVLTQDETGIVARLASGSSEDEGSAGRTALLAVGGLALLATGIGGGTILGRRRTTV